MDELKKKKKQQEALSLLWRWWIVLLVWAFFCNSAQQALCFISPDAPALLAFRASIWSDPSSALGNWDPSHDTPCSWNGVLCSTIGHEHRVVGINLPSMALSGRIPAELAGATYLQRINLRTNDLSGAIPPELANIQSLHKIILSSNHLSGGLPQELANLTSLETLDVSSNMLEGSIPLGLGLGLAKLEYLDLSDNRFTGPIPRDLGALGSLKGMLNLSRNALSGSVPESLGDLPQNVSLDLRWNNLTGPIPQRGSLANQGATAFLGNAGLCGFPLSNPCPGGAGGLSPSTPMASAKPPGAAVEETPRSDDGRGDGGLGWKQILAIAAGDAVGIALMGLVFIYCFKRHKPCDYFRGRSKNGSNQSETSASASSSNPECWLCYWCCSCCCSNGEGSEWLADEGGGTEGELVLFDSEESLRFDLEDLLRASAYVIGKGSSGIVYKAVLESGVTLAVRRLAGDGASGCSRKQSKEFDTEVQLVGRIRHPCIVKLRAYYCGQDEKLLVYDYIPNGSLATALHGQSAPYSLTSLTWAERLKIGKRVAEGLAHIHDCGPRKYIHGDIRPENILLTSNMDAYISDFGLSRLVAISGSATTSRSSSRNANSSSLNVVAAAHSFNGNDQPLGITPNVEPHGKDGEAAAAAFRPPEAESGHVKPTQKWDVYAFGVVMLELISGRNAVQQQQQQQANATCTSSTTTMMPLVAWAEKMWEGKRPVYEVLDPTLMNGIAPQQQEVLEFLRIALSCVVASPEHRPKMKQVSESLKKIGP